MVWLCAAAATFASTYWKLGLRFLARSIPSKPAFMDSTASLLRRLPAALPFPHGFPLLKPWQVLSSVHDGDAQTAACSTSVVLDCRAAHRTRPPVLSFPLWNAAKMS